jgi:hypothetical protein
VLPEPLPDQAEITFCLGWPQEVEDEFKVEVNFFSGRRSTSLEGLADLIPWGETQYITVNSMALPRVEKLHDCLTTNAPSVKRLRLIFRLSHFIDTLEALKHLAPILQEIKAGLMHNYDLCVQVRMEELHTLIQHGDAPRNVLGRCTYDAVMAMLIVQGCRMWPRGTDGELWYIEEPRVWKDVGAAFGYGRNIDVISWLPQP